MIRSADDELTVDELAARAGITVRTVRFYATRGLLPPPALRGRTGVYGPHHLARLDLIRELQSLGFTLAAIERRLTRIPEDASAEEIGLQRALLTPWISEESEELDRNALNQRAGRHLDDEVVDQLAALGVLERLPANPGTGTDNGDPERVLLHGSAMLDIGLQILDLRMPMDMMLQAKKIVDQHTSAIAAELQELFLNNVVRPYREHGRLADEREQVRDAMEKLRPVTIQALVTGFQRAVNDVIRNRTDTSSE